MGWFAKKLQKTNRNTIKDESKNLKKKTRKRESKGMSLITGNKMLLVWVKVVGWIVLWVFAVRKVKLLNVPSKTGIVT